MSDTARRPDVLWLAMHANRQPYVFWQWDGGGGPGETENLDEVYIHRDEVEPLYEALKGAMERLDRVMEWTYENGIDRAQDDPLAHVRAPLLRYHELITRAEQQAGGQ